MRDEDIFTGLATASRITESLVRGETVLYKTGEFVEQRFNNEDHLFMLSGLCDKDGTLKSVYAEFFRSKNPKSDRFFIAGDEVFSRQAGIAPAKLLIECDGHKLPDHFDRENTGMVYVIRHYLELMNSIGDDPHIQVIGTEAEFNRFGIPLAVADKPSKTKDEFSILIKLSYRCLKNGFNCDKVSVSFECRFGGVSYPIDVPYRNIVALYTKDRFGMAFEQVGIKELLTPSQGSGADTVSLEDLIERPMVNVSSDFEADDSPVDFDTLLNS